MRILLALLTLPALALDNAVILQEAAGTAQPGRPVTISRFFAQGEFPSGTYPKPRVDGVEADAWQADVKTRWPDGSLQHALVSLRASVNANAAAKVDFVKDTKACHLGAPGVCESAALTTQQMLDFDAGAGVGAWSAQIRATLNGISVTRDGRAMLGSGKWSYWLRGPVVTQVLVEDLTTALAYNFGWEWNGTAWQSPSGEQFASLRPAFDLAFWPEAGSHGAWPGVWVQARLYNDSTTRQQRLPLAKLEVLAGATGESAWSMCSSGCTVTGSPVMQARRSFRKDVWSGAAPGAVATDFNLPYLIHSRIVPQFDLGVTPAATHADASLTGYNANAGADIQWCASTTYCGPILKSMTNTGGRFDIGLMPKWQVDYLMSMGHAGVTTARKLEIWQKLIVGIADAATSLPVHYMETDASAARDTPADGQRYYFHAPANTTDRAFGRILSINARPEVYLYQDYEYNTGTWNNDADVMRFVCAATASPCGPDTDRNGWTVDLAHWPALTGLPYFLTGNPFYLREQQMIAAWALASRNYSRQYLVRAGEWGLIWGTGVMRARAWGMREMYWAALASPDGGPEKAYFLEKLKFNEELAEGYYNIAEGHYGRAGACTSPFNRYTEKYAWCMGRYGIATGGAAPGESNYVDPDSNSLNMFSTGYAVAPVYGVWNNGVDRLDLVYQGYYVTVVQNWIWEMKAFLERGTPLFEHVRQADAKYMLGMVLAPDAHPHLSAGYHTPVGRMDGASRRYVNSWAEWSNAFVLTGTLDAAVTPDTTSFVVATSGTLATAPGFVKIGGEWIRTCNWATGSPAAGKVAVTVCAGGRGAWGTQAASHAAGAATEQYVLFHAGSAMDLTGGYPVLGRAARSFLTDIRLPSGSGQRALEWMEGALPSQENAGTNLMWRYAARDRIERVRVERNGASAVLRWGSGSVKSCRVRVGVAEAVEPSDESDGVAAGGSREQSFGVSGLSAGSEYHYRITCGTARVRGAFVAAAP